MISQCKILRSMIQLAQHILYHALDYTSIAALDSFLWLSSIHIS